MSDWIILSVGIVGGILFSFAFPEPALAVNETLSPMVSSGFDFITNVFKDIIGKI